MKIRHGDNVVVTTGKDKGKTGKVLRVLPTTNRVVVAGVNMRTRHVKATPQRAGQKIQYEASLHWSNVMLVDPKTKKRTRVGFGTDAKGKKQRVAKRSGEALPNTKAGAATSDRKAEDKVKKSAKKDESSSASASAKATEDKGQKKEADSTTKQTDTAGKKPFWKRITGGGTEAEAAETKEGSHMSEDHSVPDQVERQSARSHQRGS